MNTMYTSYEDANNNNSSTFQASHSSIGIMNSSGMTINDHLHSMPHPSWFESSNFFASQPFPFSSNNTGMMGMMTAKTIMHSPITQHHPVIVSSRCDDALPSSSDTSSSSCSPSSSENTRSQQLQQQQQHHHHQNQQLEIKTETSSLIDANIISIVNHAMKSEPMDGDYMDTIHQHSIQSMPIHPGNYSSCDERRTSSDIIPSSILSRRSRSSHDGLLKCQFCPKKFAEESALHSHMSDCRLIRSHECPQCGKRFKARGGLQQHLRIHSNHRPFICHFCTKKFTQKSHVDQHERIHTGAKPFNCQFCGRAFRQRSQQLGHEATHINQTSQRAMSDCDVSPSLNLLNLNSSQCASSSSLLSLSQNCHISSSSSSFSSNMPQAVGLLNGALH